MKENTTNQQQIYEQWVGGFKVWLEQQNGIPWEATGRNGRPPGGHGRPPSGHRGRFPLTDFGAVTESSPVTTPGRLKLLLFGE